MSVQNALALSEDERAKIDNYVIQKQSIPAIRRAALILKLLDQGCMPSQVAEMLAISKSTVKEWKKKWLNQRLDCLNSERKQPLKNWREENQQIRAQLQIARSKESITQERISELDKESRHLGRRLQEVHQELENANTLLIRSLFKDIVSSREGQSALVRLLSLKDEILLPSPREEIFLRPLITYLRDTLGITIYGEKDNELELTDENRDEYVINEQVALPCRVQITIRGIQMGSEILQRPQVTTELKG